MKLSLAWLTEFIPEFKNKNPVELMHRLTMAGIEVESMNSSNDDTVFELSITPNRGDCLSVNGLAREVAAIYGKSVKPLTSEIELPSHSFSITVQDLKSCPIYHACYIEISDMPDTPAWIAKRLEQCDVKLINFIVDVTNYVMMECGQPMHAFDFDKLKSHQRLIIRQAMSGETLMLLNNQEVTLQNDTLLIAGESQPLAIAGVMGGLETAVQEDTRRVFLEVAYFSPEAVAGKARKYGLSTDSGHRFERGVDTSGQRMAMARVLDLLKQQNILVKAELVVSNANEDLSPKAINVREARVTQLLGKQISIADVFKKLEPHLSYQQASQSWKVTPKSHRSDLTIEEDIIEEIARIYGYDSIEPQALSGNLLARVNKSFSDPAIQMTDDSEKTVSIPAIKQDLVKHAYHEVVTYSFIDPKMANAFIKQGELITLKNPIAPELSVMRPSLLPGLVKSALYNLYRQRNQGKLFEIGLCFHYENQQRVQEAYLAGLAWGEAVEEQWAVKKRPVDFFDIKGDIEALLGMTGLKYEWNSFTQSQYFHPGQAAQIYQDNRLVGSVGKFHPQHLKDWDFPILDVFGFELNINAISHAKLPEFATLSKYPGIRRDFAFLVEKEVSAAQVEKALANIAQPDTGWIINRHFFDVYQGDPAAKQKSIAIALELQHQMRTLQDEEVSQYCAQVVDALGCLGAQLRG